MHLHPPTDSVSHVLQGSVLVIAIDNPPVNALGVSVRRGLLAAIQAAQANPLVRAVLIHGRGRNFIGGADIREFGKPAQSPVLTELCSAIEACNKPVLAAIHGAALGGGLEVALAAHYRLATADAKIGLPEVQLGLMPGAGGTQRAPRLMGAAAALDLMLSGRHLDGAQALAQGLIDRLATGTDLLAEGLAYTHELVAGNAPVRRTADAPGLADRAASQAAMDAARAKLQASARGLFSPLKIIDAVQAALDVPLDEGLRTERALFLQCMDSPQRAGLIHAFFAEKEVRKTPEAQGASARAVRHVGVVGGGTMGAGIAVAVLDAGLQVTMVERDDVALARGRSHIEKVYDALLAKGRISAQAKSDAMARFSGSLAYDALATADLVIEAVFEDMAVKHAVFAELDRVCKPGAVLATNTSYLDIDAIAAGTARPADVVGLHFFSPANVMKLLEIVVAQRTAADVVATAFALAATLRKVPVRSGVCDGFIGNRILAAYRHIADCMVEDGASPAQIDRAVRDFGYPMGPFQVSDLAGGDIGWATRKRKAASRDPAARYVQIADRLCERGWFGQKTGRGYYLYPQGARNGVADPEVDAIIASERARAGVQVRNFSDDDILRRYLAAMVNEGANVVFEGIALRPLDVDVTLLNGYGFPRHRGGPMHYADTVGLERILADIQTFAPEAPQFWRPSPLLLDLVARGATFGSLNHGAPASAPTGPQHA